LAEGGWQLDPGTKKSPEKEVANKNQRGNTGGLRKGQKTQKGEGKKGGKTAKKKKKTRKGGRAGGHKRESALEFTGKKATECRV